MPTVDLILLAFLLMLGVAWNTRETAAPEPDEQDEPDEPLEPAPAHPPMWEGEPEDDPAAEITEAEPEIKTPNVPPMWGQDPAPEEKGDSEIVKETPPPPSKKALW